MDKPWKSPYGGSHLPGNFGNGKKYPSSDQRYESGYQRIRHSSYVKDNYQSPLPAAKPHFTAATIVRTAAHPRSYEKESSKLPHQSNSAVKARYPYYDS